MESKFNLYTQAKQLEYKEKFDQSNLSKQFIPYFESGQRIEVRFNTGELKRGYIGVTTGWKPVFILLLRIDSISSSWTLSNEDKIVNVFRRQNKFIF